MKEYYNKPGIRELQSQRIKHAQSKPGVRARIAKGVRKNLAKPGVRARYSQLTKKHWHRYEKIIKKNLKQQGWEVLSTGWPDFVCLKGRQVMFVEAKDPSRTFPQLSPAQQRMHVILARFGIKVQIIKGV